jgi:hypothetical protein
MTSYIYILALCAFFTVIITLCSTATTLRTNQVLISSFGNLPSGGVKLYYMFDVQLFLQPHLVPDREQSVLNCFFSLISYLIGNTVSAQLFLQPHLVPDREHNQCSTVYSASSRV